MSNNSPEKADAPADTAQAAIRISPQKVWELVSLLVECRDALPVITTVQARLHRLDLTLTSRIDAAIKPWKVEPDDPRYKDAI